MIGFEFLKNKLFHMASMARSGETLMLKILSVHPNIIVMHNIEKADSKHEEIAFQFLKSYENNEISRRHSLIKPYKVKKNQILLLKQGVWQHKHHFKGFILSRNPISIYSSLKNYDSKQPEYNLQNNFWFNNEERLNRWLKDIDSSLIDSLKGKSPEAQFCIFYNARMGNLLKTGLPIIRYEDLITDLRETLCKVSDILGITMNEKLLKSHKYYEKGKMGHGNNDLSKPIDKSSLTKYKENVTIDEFNYIKENTKVIYRQYGYEIDNNEVKIL